MKKICALFFVVCIASVSFAQIKITDTFDGVGTLNWKEYVDKEVSALIKTGKLDMEVKEEGLYISSNADLPIVIEYDFKITMKLVFPKIKDEHFSAVLFDMDEKFNRLAFLFRENKFIACTYNKGKFNFDEGEEIKIKLPDGKNKEIEFVIEYKGGRLILSYDNIELLRWRRSVHSPYLGFMTTSRFMVDEVIIEQEYTGEE
ncbi:MAG: hypothetical protein IKU79_04550 [Bacteroidaceae bacterium]|nr:hypothetical protein [Bacteroidaceae bacterium]